MLLTICIKCDRMSANKGSDGDEMIYALTTIQKQAFVDAFADYVWECIENE